MKALLLILSILLQNTYGDIPNVYEFCSALMSDRETTCEGRSCQARPGKRGPQGNRGIKGEQGPPGYSDSLEQQVEMLEKTVRLLISKDPEEMQNYCLMGMKSRSIPNTAITASSTYGGNKAYYGRLDETTKNGRGTWVAGISRVGEWLQVDLGATKSVAGIITQGRPVCSCNQWTKSYKVSCGSTTNNLLTVAENGQDKVFVANNDRDTRVMNLFPSPMSCRYIRVYPQSWQVLIVLRMDVLSGECLSALSIMNKE